MKKVAEFHVTETEQPYARYMVGRLVYDGISFSAHTELEEVARLLFNYIGDRLR